MWIPKLFVLLLLASATAAQLTSPGTEVDPVFTLPLDVASPDPYVSPSPVQPPSPAPDNSPSPSPSPDVSPSPSPKPDPTPDPSPSPSPSPSPEPSPSPSPSPSPDPSPPPVVPSPPPPDDPRVEALLAFKSKITNAKDISALDSWVADGNPCNFKGVGCEPSSGTIRNILLEGLGMTGTLSDALADPALNTLQNIDLSANKLSGVVPDAYNGPEVLPELQIFDLASNSLTGGPTGWGTSGCKALQQLNIDNNNLNAFPSSWSFPGMQVLSMQNNNINDSIPSSWANVVPAGSTVIIMPQKGTSRVCGDVPAGPVWAQIVNNQPVAINSLVPCGPQPPPAASPPPAPENSPPVNTPPPPAVPSPPRSPPPAAKSGMSTGVIVAIAVGGAVGLIVLLALLFWCCRRPKKGAAGKDGQDLDGMEQGYYTADGKWVSPPTGPNGAMIAAGAVGAAAAAAGLSTLSSHRASGSLGSGFNSNGQDVGYDPLLEWAQQPHAQLSEADLAAAIGASSPHHGRSQSSGNLPLDVKMWTINFRDIKIEKQIGEGSFGRVYFAWWNETPVAVKMLIGTSSIHDEESAEAAVEASKPMLEGLAKESSMMAALRHPNVVSFLGVCLGPPCIVTEYCGKGSLTDVLRGGKASPAKAALLDWNRRLNMALDAAKGMLYLHAHAPPIIHRDLKSPNLLVDRHWRVKVSDFNLSKLMEEGSVMSSMAATNPRWLAPEILTGNNATFASDVYSFAIVMWEMLTWELPWGPTNPWQVVTVVTEGGRLEVPVRTELPGPDTTDFEGLDKYVELMRRCWAQNPDDRPTFQEIIFELRELLKAHHTKTKGRGSTVSLRRTASGTEEDSSIQRSTSLGTSPPSTGPVYSPDSRIRANSPSLESVPEPLDGTPSGQVSALDRDDSVGVEVGFSSPGSEYASTAAMTGSLANVDDLKAGWGTKLVSKLSGKKP